MFGAIAGLLGTIIGGIKDHLQGKREIKKAIVENKVRLAASAQTHNQVWEMRQLENVGAKDDVLFYGFIAMFVWAGFDPEGAQQFFNNLDMLPEWFVKIWFWIVASVLGVKKIGEYLPGAIKGITDALKAKSY